MTETEVISFNKEHVHIGKSKKGYGYTFFAKRDFKKGEEIVESLGRIISHQTSHCSIQIGIHKHFMPKKWTGRYWNHSCNPNTYANTRKDGFPSLFALKNIKKGEEIVYAYWMTEFKWGKLAKESRIDFKCKCGESNCRGNILSFSQLSKKEQKILKEKNLCSKYLYNLSTI